MIRCSNNCIPCCDFCIHAFHEYFESRGRIHKGGPEACLLHRDEKHQSIAEGCGHCDDFHCFLAKEENKDV